MLDESRNLLRIRYHGHVHEADMQAGGEQLRSLLPSLKPKFKLLTDLTDLQSMEPACAVEIRKFMDLCQTRGVGLVVRVIPDPARDIGFNIMSLFHYKRGVKIVTCETLAEAERTLN